MAADPRRSSAQADFWNPTGRDRDGRRKYHRSGRQGRLLAHQRGGLRGRGKVEGNCLGRGPLRRDVVVRPGRMSGALFGSAGRTSSRAAAPTASGCGGSQPCPASGRPAPSGSGRGTAPPPAAPRRWRDPTADPVLVSLNFAGCGVPGSADPFSRPRRGATTPPNGKFGAPLPALSAASADPLARPGTGPSLYAISSSLRAIARRSTR
jgi:hypothetical protein